MYLCTSLVSAEAITTKEPSPLVAKEPKLGLLDLVRVSSEVEKMPVVESYPLKYTPTSTAFIINELNV